MMLKNPMHKYDSPCLISIIEKSLWYICADDNVSCDLVINGHHQIKMRAGHAGILALDESTIEVKRGRLNYIKADFVQLVKLQAFIDQAESKNKQDVDARKTTSTDDAFCFLPLHHQEPMNQRRFEYWLINQNISKTASIKPLISMLRGNEYYWIVNYLLEKSSGTESLEMLGTKYGLSVSHFRRLTKVALGNATKVELCNWRLVRAILDLMGGKDSITEIALKHGYCSLSHFSNEVKNTFGLPPRELKSKIYVDVDK